MKKVIILGVAVAAALTVTSVQAREGRGGEKPVFSEIDANGDGQITQAEMQAFGAARMQARFAEADADGNGSLSAEEMVAKAREGAEDRAQRRAERMIDRLDANDNGMIEADEMPSREGRGDRAGRGFDRADQNDDGVLSQEEYDDMRGRRGGGRK